MNGVQSSQRVISYGFSQRKNYRNGDSSNTKIKKPREYNSAPLLLSPGKENIRPKKTGHNLAKSNPFKFNPNRTNSLSEFDLTKTNIQLPKLLNKRLEVTNVDPAELINNYNPSLNSHENPFHFYYPEDNTGLMTDSENENPSQDLSSVSHLHYPDNLTGASNLNFNPDVERSVVSRASALYDDTPSDSQSVSLVKFHTPKTDLKAIEVNEVTSKYESRQGNQGQLRSVPSHTCMDQVVNNIRKNRLSRFSQFKDRIKRTISPRKELSLSHDKQNLSTSPLKKIRAWFSSPKRKIHPAQTRVYDSNRVVNDNKNLKELFKKSNAEFQQLDHQINTNRLHEVKIKEYQDRLDHITKLLPDPKKLTINTVQKAYMDLFVELAACKQSAGRGTKHLTELRDLAAHLKSEYDNKFVNNTSNPYKDIYADFNYIEEQYIAFTSSILKS